MKNIGLLGAGGLLVAGLSGCAEEEMGPQFANNPAPTATANANAGLPTTAPATPFVVATPVAATPVSIADVLSTRGAASRIFLAAERAIWSVDVNGESTSVLAAEPGEQVLAIGPSPDASQVAVIVAIDGGRETSLIVLDAAGDVMGEIALATRPAATPAAGERTPGAVAVDWSPQGDQILLLLADGSLQAVAADLSTEPELISLGDTGGSVLEPAWSPTGQQIGFLLFDPDTRTRALNVYDLQRGDTHEVVGATDGRFVVEFAWEPGGQDVLFTEAAALGGVTTGIDLWRIGVDGEGRELVAAAGTAAPVARITTVTPSPDGKSVAYAALVPGEESPRVDSVWVRELESGQGFRLGLPSMRSVEDIWWTTEGLAVATVTDRRNEPILAVLLVAPNGNVSALWAAPLAAATPFASPVATASDPAS